MHTRRDSRASFAVPEALLTVDVSDDGAGTVVLSVVGEVDQATRKTFNETLHRAVHQPDVRRVEVNLAKVPFMDSSGINALVRCRQSAGPRQVVVTDPHPAVQRVLELCGITAMLS